MKGREYWDLVTSEQGPTRNWGEWLMDVNDVHAACLARSRKGASFPKVKTQWRSRTVCPHRGACAQGDHFNTSIEQGLVVRRPRSCDTHRPVACCHLKSEASHLALHPAGGVECVGRDQGERANAHELDGFSWNGGTKTCHCSGARRMSAVISSAKSWVIRVMSLLSFPCLVTSIGGPT